MTSIEENLTHEEIWDDSALVNSWNDALEEYKKYHSIHSKGGNVDDLLENGSIITLDAKEETKIPQPPIVDSAGEQQEWGSQKAPTSHEDNGKRETQHVPAGAAAVIPAPLLGSVRDESLKKLLMSWYYAGYYTGYHEAQRDQSSNPPS